MIFFEWLIHVILHRPHKIWGFNIFISLTLIIILGIASLFKELHVADIGRYPGGAENYAMLLEFQSAQDSLSAVKDSLVFLPGEGIIKPTYPNGAAAINQITLVQDKLGKYGWNLNRLSNLKSQIPNMNPVTEYLGNPVSSETFQQQLYSLEFERTEIQNYINHIEDNLPFYQYKGVKIGTVMMHICFISLMVLIVWSMIVAVFQFSYFIAWVISL